MCNCFYIVLHCFLICILFLFFFHPGNRYAGNYRFNFLLFLAWLFTLSLYIDHFTNTNTFTNILLVLDFVYPTNNMHQKTRLSQSGNNYPFTSPKHFTNEAFQSRMKNLLTLIRIGFPDSGKGWATKNKENNKGGTPFTKIPRSPKSKKGGAGNFRGANSRVFTNRFYWQISLWLPRYQKSGIPKPKTNLIYLQIIVVDRLGL